MLSEGKAPSSVFWPEPIVPPTQDRTVIIVSAEKGWRRDAGKLPMNRGESAVCIYTHSSYLVNWVDY